MQVRVNEPDVVFEAFDDETVLVNLDSGSYYSLRASGPKVWTALAAGVRPSDLAGAIASAAGLPAQTVLAQLEDLVAALTEAKLVVAADKTDAPAAEWSGGYETPVLETYTDMQDLLLLDPVHDVDQAGWPKAKEA
jgi:hypothetical protein